MKRTFVIVCALVCAAIAATAQEFDLSTQRLESQYIPPVPGEKIDHGDLILNPTPQNISMLKGGRMDFSAGFKVMDRSGVLAAELAFLENTQTDPKARKIKVTVDFGQKAAAKAGVRAVDGAYRLTIDSKGISITGYNERGAYYGIQTLRQIIQAGQSAWMDINDWPELKYRGVVEGFYGTPWSHEVRMSLIDFFGKFKMNTYVYGPKDDPFHSCPRWREPYPADEAARLKELVEACKRNRVDFVWAIHPGQDIKWNEEDYQRLLAKFNLMYDMGVRDFAVFFDDIDGEGTNPVKQVDLMNRLNSEFVKAKGDVGNLIVCPTDYSKLWANPGPEGPLSVYGKSLDKDINVFWTGDYVCSDLTESTLEWVNSRIQRPALYWWNFPVTDYARHIVMLGPAYGLDKGLTSEQTAGLLSNPMEYGESSKVALYGVADYAWNTGAYNPIDNWERALAELVPEATEAFRTFAIHSCDTETGYRRSESWETETFLAADCTPARYEALKGELEKVVAAPAAMREKCGNALLMTEIGPWLTEFGKLGERCLTALELIKLYEAREYEAFWKTYCDNLMSPEDLEAYNAHKSGTLKLQPFYENTMDDLGAEFYKAFTGMKSSFKRGVGSFRNIYTTMNKLMFDQDSTTYYTSGESQTPGSWIGVDLGEIIPVNEVSILQGRNSIDDVDYFDHCVLEWSADGRTWTPMSEEYQKQYIISWKGEPVQARYVRLLRLDSDRNNWASVRTFEVNPMSIGSLGISLEADSDRAIAAFDRNIQSKFALTSAIGFDVAAGAQTLVILTGSEDSRLTVSQSDADGTVIGTQTVSGSYIQIPIETTSARLRIEGQADIYEVIVL